MNSGQLFFASLHSQRRRLRRRGLRLVLANSALWSAGNGLTSGAIVVYLAFEMGAGGGGIGWVLAAPALAGLLRLFFPPIIRFFGSPQKTCLIAWRWSYVMVWGLPILAMPACRFENPAIGVTLLVVVLSLHQLLEYVGVIGYWSWMGELIPRRIRGRFLARRNRWQLAVLIPTLLASSWFVDEWSAAFAAQGDSAKSWGYVIATSLGGLLLWASLAPLARAARIHRNQPRKGADYREDVHPSGSSTQPVKKESSATESTSRFQASEILAPFRDRRFLWLVAFGCFVGFANGLTQSAQNYANKETLAISLLTLAGMRTAMRLGQYSVSGPIGRFCDRYGNRPVLIACQAVVATGPLFYFLATPEQPFWIWGAWLAWSAFAGLNICLPNLMLKLSPAQNKAGYLAAYFAVSGAVYALSTVAGGYLLDWLLAADSVTWLGWKLSAERALFLTGWLLRSASVVFLLMILEPNAARLFDLVLRWTRIRGRRIHRTTSDQPPL